MRTGHFIVSMLDYSRSTNGISLIPQSVRVTSCEHKPHIAQFEFFAESELFEDVPFNTISPTYAVIRDGVGNFVRFEKVDKCRQSP